MLYTTYTTLISSACRSRCTLACTCVQVKVQIQITDY